MAKQAKAQSAKKTAASTAASIETPRWESKRREYRLTGQYAKSPWLKLQAEDRPGGVRLLYFDPELKKYRALRYVINHESPFIDDQEGHEVVQEQIIFQGGVLGVGEYDVALQKFLSFHPENAANGGKMFYEYDPAAIAKKEVDMLKVKAEAMRAALDMDITTASALLRPTMGRNVHSQKTDIITRHLLKMAEEKPEELLDELDNPNLMVKYLAYTSVDFGICKFTDSGQVYRWAENDQKLLAIPFGEDKFEFITQWFSTDEGLEVMNNITAKLKK